MTNLSVLFVLAAVFVLIPGFTFRSLLFPKYLSDYRLKSSSLFQITLALGTGLFFQFIALSFVDYYNPFGLIIDWRLIGDIIIPSENTSYAAVLGKIGVQNKWILVYNLALNLGCAIFGWIARLVILYFNFDILFSSTRFSNDWHYILSGRDLRSTQYKIRSIKSAILWLKSLNSRTLQEHTFSQYASICVKLEDTVIMIYYGILADYAINDTTGELELLKIKNPTRHTIHLPEDDKSKEWEYTFPLSVDMLMIPYNQVVNFALTYYELDLIEENIEEV